jgi:hypothetical protein
MEAPKRQEVLREREAHLASVLLDSLLTSLSVPDTPALEPDVFFLKSLGASGASDLFSPSCTASDSFTCDCDGLSTRNAEDILKEG